MAARLLLLAVAVPHPPSLSTSWCETQARSLIPVSLGSFLTAPAALALMRKMKEVQAGRIPSPPPSLLPTHSLCSSSRFFSPAALTLPLQQLAHPRLLQRWGAFHCNKVEVSVVSILNFSGIIPSDVICVNFFPLCLWLLWLGCRCLNHKTQRNTAFVIYYFLLSF